MIRERLIRALKLVSGIVLLALGFWAGTSWDLLYPRTSPQEMPKPRALIPRGDLSADEQTTIELFKEASPSVVYITTLVLRRYLFSLNVLEIPQGTGSGIVWDQEGHIVTNFHVIRNANAAKVTLADQSSWDAQLVGTAPEKDLAVLRIETPTEALRPILLGSSYDLKVGQKVFAIGNPFGLDQSLTTGVISALGREIESMAQIPIRDVIQTDAAINPGNSGGPLLDSAGRLVGINTAIYSPSGAYAGIGFAIPVDTVNWVVPDLIAHGKLKRPALGIQAAGDYVTRRLGIDGVLVLEVLEGSGAQQAGLRPTRRNRFGQVELGDVIVDVDGQTLHSTADLILLLEKRQLGDRVTLTILRNGAKQQVICTLEEAR